MVLGNVCMDVNFGLIIKMRFRKIFCSQLPFSLKNFQRIEILSKYSSFSSSDFAKPVKPLQK